MQLKEKLLKNRIIWEINASIKSFSVVSKYYLWKIYYTCKKNKDVKIPLLMKNDKPNVIYVGTDEKQDKSGFYQALLANCQKVIPFTKEDGTWGQYDSDIKDCADKNIKRLEKIIINSNSVIDCVLMQSWGFSFDCDEMNKLKKIYNFKVINIDMDSRLVHRKIFCVGKQNPGIYGLCKCVDLMLVTTREIVTWYLKEGIPALYFPLASSESFYFPMDVDRIYDVGFIGQNYGIRKEIVEYLLQNGVKVEARGTGWLHGPIEYTQNNLFFNQCKIVLGIGNIAYCKHFYNPKLRDYDAPMSGSVYVTNKTNELLHDYKDGYEIVLISNKKDLVKKIKELLMDENRMDEIRKNAVKRARTTHTYEKQIKELFDKICETTGAELK